MREQGSSLTNECQSKTEFGTNSQAHSAQSDATTTKEQVSALENVMLGTSINLYGNTSRSLQSSLIHPKQKRNLRTLPSFTERSVRCSKTDPSDVSTSPAVVAWSKHTMQDNSKDEYEDLHSYKNHLHSPSSNPKHFTEEAVSVEACIPPGCVSSSQTNRNSRKQADQPTHVTFSNI